MKRLIVIFFVISAVALALGAKVVENTGKPAAKNAGRLAKMTEVLRIEDDGKDFYFKSPRQLKIGGDGSIYVRDDKQFLKFDKNGTFVGNFLKIGEGPGECSSVSGYTVNADHIMVLAAQPFKILKLDLAGKLIKEIRLLKNARGYQRLLGFFGERFYYLLTEFQFDKLKSGVMKFPQKLHVSTFDDQKTDLKLNFPIERYMVVKTANGGMMAQMRDLASNHFVVENEHAMYFSHTKNYLINIVDIAEGKIIRQFKRQYNPVKYIPRDDDTGPGKLKGFLDEKTVFNDIMGLVLFKGKLLVFTSTLDEEKGVQVDVFSKDGKYLDSVFLPLKELHRPDSLANSSVIADGDYLYLLEKDEEDVYAIVKYKLEL